MSTLTLRTAKGSPLTNAEVDANFTNLLVALGGSNVEPYTLPTPTGTGSPVLSASPTFTGTVSGISASMVGLGNVTNTSDANKPVSTAQQTALDLKANLASPTFTGTVSGITKTMVGLGSVDNTADSAKPVSTAQQTALNLKANLASPTFTGNVLIGAGASATRFPNALSIASSVSTGGQAEPHVIGMMGEGLGSVTTSTATGLNSVNTITLGAANAAILVGQGVSGTGIAPNATVTAVAGTSVTLSANNIAAVSGTITFANYGVGLYGAGYTSGLARSGGVIGEGHVSATGDGGSAIGVRGYSNDTHAGGLNIGLYGDATGGASNYSLYLNRGDIYSAGAQNWTLNGNLTLTGAYTVTIPTLSLGNALPIASGGTGSTSLTANNVLLGNGTNALQVVAPGTNGNILTSNGSTWVSSPAPITLPSQTSNNGKFLTTDGSTASWGTIPISLPSQSGAGGKFLTTDGTNATWSSIPLVDNTYTVTGISGTAATIAVDFSTVSSSTIIIPLPSGTTSATITFTNLASKATSGTIFSFSVILSHVTALTNTTSVAWRHGSALLPKWTGNIIPPNTITANAIDIWTFFTYDAGSSLVGSLSMADVRNA